MNNKTFTITYENETVTQPAHVQALESLKQGIDAHITEFKLQARAIGHDTRYGTHYFAIRRQLLKAQREEQFIASIGLERISREEQKCIDKRARNLHGQFVRG